MLSKTLSFVGYLALVAIFGFAIRYFFVDARVQNGTGLSSKAFFAASFADEKNIQNSMNTHRGKILVLNFWATWCPPCREEMPELSVLHQQYQSKGVEVLGLAIDDVETIRTFQKENPVSYPLFAADMQGMEIAAALGNSKGVLPYSVIIKSDGNVAKTYSGRISKPLLEETLLTLLPQH